MPVDNANKRGMMLGAVRPFVVMLPVPDGSFATASNRAQLAMQYFVPSVVPVSTTRVTRRYRWVRGLRLPATPSL